MGQKKEENTFDSFGLQQKENDNQQAHVITVQERVSTILENFQVKGIYMCIFKKISILGNFHTEVFTSTLFFDFTSWFFP